MTTTRLLRDITATRTPDAQRTSRRHLAAVLCLTLAGAAALAGCSTGSNNGRAAVQSENDAAVAAAPDAQQSRSEQLDEIYLIGPRAALGIGYRIDWQSTVRPATDGGFKFAYVTDASVYVLDERNNLARVQRDNGRLHWVNFVARPVENVHGMIYLPNMDRVYATTDGQMMVVENHSGELVDRQTLGESASTAPVQYGAHLIYGSPTGRLAWHSYGVGQMWRAYQVANALEIQPVIYGNMVLTVGQDGIVSSLHAPRVSRLWQYRALAGISARPVAANNVLYVSSRDQYIRAFEISSGRTLWAYLSRSPLETSPVVIRDRVYQYVEDEGVICLEARPRNAPGGRLIWSSPDAVGEVLTSVRDRILVWDRDAQVMTILAASTGDIVSRVELPGVQHLHTTTREDGQLVAVAADGRVIRLSPRAGG